MKNVIDSSVWIEHFVTGSLPREVVELIRDPDNSVVPTVVLLEVGRWLMRRTSDQETAQLLGWMSRGEIVPLDLQLAKEAAEAAVTHQLPLADSIIFATSRARGATLWTMDRHFAGLPGVRCLTRPHPSA